MTWANGDTYEGDWQNGKRHGEGVQLNRDGSRYAGGWHNDRENGYGRAEFIHTIPAPEGYSTGASLHSFQSMGGGKESWDRISEALINTYVGEWANGMPAGRGKRNWGAAFYTATKLPDKTINPKMAVGPFSPDADMLRRVRTSWPAGKSIGGRRGAQYYDGYWLDGDWHGNGIFNVGKRGSSTSIVIRSTFEHGGPDKRLEIIYDEGSYYWSIGLDGRKFHGDYVYRNDEYQWEWKFDQGKKVFETGHYLDGKRPKSIMPGLIAGAAMMAGVKSVGGDSGTALEMALAFGSDVQNNTMHNTRQQIEQMETRYQALKAENDARLKNLLDRAWESKQMFNPDGTPVVSNASSDVVKQPDGVVSSGQQISPSIAAADILGAQSTASAASATLDARFLGTYRFSDTSYWTLNADGSGTWSAGFLDGSSEKIAIQWWPLIDSKGGVQKAVLGNEAGYLLGVRYTQPVSERVRKGMTFAAQESDESMVRVYGSADGAKCCWLQFHGQLNAVYKK